MPRRLSSPLLTGMLVLTGCQHSSQFAPLAINFPPAKAGEISMSGGPELRLQMQPKEIDLHWLYADEFFPPGAVRIGPADASMPRLYDTPRAKFPSEETCVSPNGILTLFSDSTPTRMMMVHWLMAHRQGIDLASSLFHTANAFEVVWSGDSRHAAITDFVGHNRSEVVMMDMTDFSKSDPINLAPALEPYFSPLQLSSPTFVRAHRWSEGALVLVRGVGRLALAPFDQFGYEVLVDSSKSADSPSMTFLRGYTKPNVAQ